MTEDDNAIIIPELALPYLDPSEWDCPPLSTMPSYQQQKRRMRRMASPHLTNEEWTAWDTIIRELFSRDEERAVRFAIGWLTNCWGMQSADKVYRQVASDHRIDAIYRRNLQREVYEQRFRTWGDIVINIIDEVGDITSGAYLLDEITQFLDELPTQVEKRLLVIAAHQSSFWRLVIFLAENVGSDPSIADPQHVIQAHRWMEAWESLRKGQSIGIN